MVLLALSIIPFCTVTVLAEGEAGEEVQCGGHEGWTAITKETIGTICEEGLMAGTSYYLAEDVETTASIGVKKGNEELSGTAVTLCLNGHSITANHNVAVFNVYSGAQLNVYDCCKGSGNAGKIMHSADYVEETNANGFFLYNNSTLNLYGGEIADNYYGVDGNSGSVVNLDGATFTGNVYGIDVSSSMTVNIKSGTITKNSNSALVITGTVNMSGGSITGNEADYDLVWVGTGGRLNMSGGSIKDNQFDGSHSALYVVENGSVNITGDGVWIYDNMCGYTQRNIELAGTEPLTVSAELTPEKTKLGICSSGLENIAVPDGVTITTLAPYTECFCFDSNERIIVADNTTGALKIIEKTVWIEKEPSSTNPSVTLGSLGGEAYSSSYQWYEVAKDGTMSMVDGETEAELKNPVAGKTYTCKISINNMYTLVSKQFIFEYVFITQPTVEKPVVEVNVPGDVSGYQWYEGTRGDVKVTDELAEPDSYYENEAKYDSELDQWTGFPLDENTFYFVLYMHAGETLTLTASGEVDDGTFELQGYDAVEPISLTAVEGQANTWNVTVDKADIYLLAATKDISDVTVSAVYTSNVGTLTEISTETSATLSEAAMGKSYLCKVSFKDGTVLTSDVFTVLPVITTQPTKTSPTVVTNAEGDVAYQWYEVISKATPVTDRNIFDGVLSGNYDSVSGTWYGMPMGNVVIYFCIELNDGDVLTVTTPVAFASDGIGIGTNGGSYEMTAADSEGKVWRITAEADGQYMLVAQYEYAQYPISATLGVLEGEALEGENTATLANYEVGKKYYCVLTLEDDTTLTSETVAYDAAEITGASITAAGDLTMNYYVEVTDTSLITDASKLSMSFTFNGNTVIVDDYKTSDKGAVGK